MQHPVHLHILALVTINSEEELCYIDPPSSLPNDKFSRCIKFISTIPHHTTLYESWIDITTNVLNLHSYFTISMPLRTRDTASLYKATLQSYFMPDNSTYILSVNSYNMQDRICERINETQRL